MSLHSDWSHAFSKGITSASPAFLGVIPKGQNGGLERRFELNSLSVYRAPDHRIDGIQAVLIGDTLALTSAFAFAIASIAIAKAARDQSADNGVLLSILMTGALSALGWLLEESSTAAKGASTSSAIGWFAASGLLATVWGRLTLFKAIELAGVIRATTIRRLTPFLSALLAWLFLGETISTMGALGMAFMGASFIILYEDGRRKLTITEIVSR